MAPDTEDQPGRESRPQETGDRAEGQAPRREERGFPGNEAPRPGIASANWGWDPPSPLSGPPDDSPLRDTPRAAPRPPGVVFGWDPPPRPLTPESPDHSTPLRDDARPIAGPPGDIAFGWDPPPRPLTPQPPEPAPLRDNPRPLPATLGETDLPRDQPPAPPSAVGDQSGPWTSWSSNTRTDSVSSTSSSLLLNWSMSVGKCNMHNAASFGIKLECLAALRVAPLHPQLGIEPAGRGSIVFVGVGGCKNRSPSTAYKFYSFHSGEFLIKCEEQHRKDRNICSMMLSNSLGI